MNERVLTRAEVRRVDRYAIESLGIPGILLMENAGRGCADVLGPRIPAQTSVAIWCGPGNNGGDGYVLARHLAVRGIPARCIQVGSPPRQADAAFNGRIAHSIEAIDFVQLDPESLDDAWPNCLSSIASRPISWHVDAMLGTGASGALRHPFRTIVERLNALETARFSVDMPTGLDCDLGTDEGVSFQAEVTCTFVGTKPGLLTEKGREVCGELRCLDIGIPAEIVDRAIRWDGVPEH